MNKQNIINDLVKYRAGLIDMVCNVNNTLRKLGYKDTAICTSHCKCYIKGECEKK